MKRSIAIITSIAVMFFSVTAIAADNEALTPPENIQLAAAGAGAGAAGGATAGAGAGAGAGVGGGAVIGGLSMTTLATGFLTVLVAGVAIAASGGDTATTPSH